MFLGADLPSGRPPGEAEVKGGAAGNRSHAQSATRASMARTHPLTAARSDGIWFVREGREKRVMREAEPPFHSTGAYFSDYKCL